MINLSASFVVIILLHKGLTHVYSQIKPRLLFGESFILNVFAIFAIDITCVSPGGDMPIEDGVPEILQSHRMNICTAHDSAIPSAHG